MYIIIMVIVLPSSLGGAPVYRVRILNDSSVLYIILFERLIPLFIQRFQVEASIYRVSPRALFVGYEKYAFTTVLFIDHNTCLAEQARLIKNLPVPLGTLAGKECV